MLNLGPMSKKKRWNLVKVVEKSSEVDVAAMRAARKQAESLASEVTEEKLRTRGDRNGDSRRRWRRIGKLGSQHSLAVG